MQKILFVCLGNICRSPLAEGVFSKLIQEAGLAKQFEVDSAGTAGYHVEERPHRGSQRVAQAHGVSLDGQCARQIVAADFDRFDWLIGMDRANVNTLLRLRPDARDKVHLLLDFDETDVKDVHDPYYDDNFEHTYRQVETGCQGFLKFLGEQRSRTPAVT